MDAYMHVRTPGQIDAAAAKGHAVARAASEAIDINEAAVAAAWPIQEWETPQYLKNKMVDLERERCALSEMLWATKDKLTKKRAKSRRQAHAYRQLQMAYERNLRIVANVIIHSNDLREQNVALREENAKLRNAVAPELTWFGRMLFRAAALP